MTLVRQVPAFHSKLRCLELASGHQVLGFCFLFLFYFLKKGSSCSASVVNLRSWELHELHKAL